MDGVEREVAEAMRAYVEAFTRQDPAAAAAHYQTPCLWLTDQGPVVVGTQEELVAQFAALLERLRASGYTGSAFTALHVRALGERTALVSAAVARYGEGGRELERIGATYTLHQGDAGWKITVLVVHPPDRVVPLS
jgi:ketosteroid isomerase-like protein